MSGPEPEKSASCDTHTTERPALKLWLPLAVVVVYWIAVECSHRFELGMFQRFVSRMISLLALLLFFLVWGLTRKHFSRRQRFFLLTWILGSAIVAGLFSDPSMGVPAMLMLGLPIALSLGTVVALLLKRSLPKTKVWGIAAASLVTFLALTLFRWDGLDGRQRTQLSWRWQPEAEELFLAGQTPETNTDASADIADQSHSLVAGDGDWTQLRGGPADAVIHNVELGNDWKTNPPKEIWRRRVGPGWSSVIAVGDLLFTQEQRGPKEAVVCYAAGDGTEVWEYTSPSADHRFDETLSGPGPRATPVFDRGRIYAYGARGHLCCLDATTGQPIWSHEVFDETGATVPQWGSATSPLVVDDLVVAFAGGTDDQGLLACARDTGELVWKTPAGTTSYATPMLATIAGLRQIVMQDESGVYGIDPADGRQLWKYDSPYAGSFQPMIQPHLVEDDHLIVGWDAGILCLEIQCDGESWSPTVAWSSNEMKPGFNDFVIHEGAIYGLDDGILACFDLASHQRVWKRGRYGFGQLMLLPDVNELLILSEKGELVRVAASPERHQELAKFNAIDGKTWNHPLVAHGRIVVRNGEEMACFELPTSNDDLAQSVADR